MKLLLLTLDEGYLLTAAPPDLERGIAPLGPPAPAHGKEMHKSKMAVWGVLTNSCEKKRSEKQRRKGKIYLSIPPSFILLE